MSKNGGNFTLGTTFALTYLKRNPKIASLVSNFEEAVTILGDLRREMDVALKGKAGWIEFKHWQKFRKKSFLNQIVKDVQADKPVRWIFSNGIGSKEDLVKLVNNLLDDAKYLEGLLDANNLRVLERNRNKIIKSIDVTDFHIKF